MESVSIPDPQHSVLLPKLNIPSTSWGWLLHPSSLNTPIYSEEEGTHPVGSGHSSSVSAGEKSDFVLISGLCSVKLCPVTEGPPGWRIQSCFLLLPEGLGSRARIGTWAGGSACLRSNLRSAPSYLGDPSLPQCLILKMRITRGPNSKGLDDN